MESFLSELYALLPRTALTAEKAKKLPVVYSGLHGTGAIPVSTMLIVLAAVTPVLLMRIFLAALIAVKWWCFMVWIKTDPVA